MNEATIADLSAKLESAFQQVHYQRMADIPILNDRIEVRAIDFQIWQTSYLGVMITPWFMNLMLLPGDHDNWDSLADLSKHNHNFPSGSYEFTVGFEADIGKYQVCSLFSPMFEFADNQAAIDTAQSVMHELMRSKNVDNNEIKEEEIEKTLSRRDLLRGAAFRQNEAS